MLLNTAYQYQLYEMAHAALLPARALSDAANLMFRNPFNPLSATPFGRNIAAGAPASISSVWTKCIGG